MLANNQGSACKHRRYRYSARYFKEFDTVQRPFISKSFKELEEIFRKASRDKDHEFLRLLDHELTFRQKNQKTPALRKEVAESLAKAPVSQADLFAGAAPSPAKVRSAARPAAQHSRPASRRKPKFKPTDEQDAALQAFLKGNSLKINAFAGSGKTSTLQLLANATGLRGQYLAFNKSIVADAGEKFPETVDCSTSHSLAFRAAPSGYKRDIGKLTNRCTAKQLVEVLDIKRRRFGDKYAITPDSQGYLYLETVRRYAQSADEEIGPQHVPVLGAIRAAPEDVRQEVSSFALEGARHVWERMLSEQDPLPLGHDGYLKLWGLSRPIIAADYIMLDEAQDTNPVVLDILQRQRGQLIYVGDRYQQIYEWRGAVNAMESIDTDASTYLTTSFRFGDAIADLATKMLVKLGESQPVRGNPGLASRIGNTNPAAVLARTNATTISAVIDALDEGKKPHLVGDKSELMDMLRGVQSLKEEEPSTCPAFFGFKSWNEVVEFARTDEGAHLVTFVNLVEKRGEKQLMWALNRTVDEEKADLVISTGHKSKGREWKSVRLMDDFLRSSPGDNKGGTPDPAEMRLLYVALTRAKESLEVPEPILQFIERGIPPEREKVENARPRAAAPARTPTSSPQSRAPAPPRPPPPPAPVVASPAPVDRRLARKGILGWLFGK
ncbi:ATP-dependent helicase [Rhizobium leguminosarum]|uniref:ATP-dependent helicase n=1 Tax=Rhizobium leguminosarum TaxID=384 RepID=A0AAJ1A6I8_RHILE|nr:UvrD-helicase domain-containing protein [Rhizobium leguminosarum]MBY5532849.1 ATP-dependent helicase [Rhizobium leguminosarum]MBY5594273.1 ATP-dependent helicase [Rhizobium leguminosarum]MBY5627950.1 ATP-dependent helicase [Rhizobium leguminosarum]